MPDSTALETSALLQKAEKAEQAGDRRRRPSFSWYSAVEPITNGFTRLRRDQNIIENSGSQARDHLANERTYLAWIRTSLSLIGASIGILKWENSLEVEGYLIGALGVVSFVSSTWRYFHIQHLLLEGSFEPNVCKSLKESIDHFIVSLKNSQTFCSSFGCLYCGFAYLVYHLCICEGVS